RARRIEQRMHDDGFGVGLRPLQPERFEDRELLALGVAGRDCEAAGGKAEVQAFGEGAEIARAEKDRDLVVIIRAIDRGMQAKAGETDIGARIRRRELSEREHARGIDDVMRKALIDLENVDAVGIIETAVEELRLE